MRHVAKFIIIALYSGSRCGFGRSADSGYVDLEHGFWMPQPGRRQTNKRQPAIRLPDRLLAHMRRWHRRGQRYVVEWHGQPVRKMDHGFRDAVKAAGLTASSDWEDVEGFIRSRSGNDQEMAAAQYHRARCRCRRSEGARRGIGAPRRYADTGENRQRQIPCLVSARRRRPTN